MQKYISTGLGFNMRGNPLSAILAPDHLDRLNYTINTKNKNMEKISDKINKYLPDLKIPFRHPSFTYGTFYSFQCKWEQSVIKRDFVLNEFLNAGLLVDKPSGVLNNQPVIKDSDLIFHICKI